MAESGINEVGSAGGHILNVVSVPEYIFAWVPTKRRNANNLMPSLLNPTAPTLSPQNSPEIAANRSNPQFANRTMASTASPTPQDQNGPAPAPNIEEAAVPSPSVSATPAPGAYSAFPPNQTKLIIALASFAGTFSPLSSFIFFPAIDDLARSLDVSVGKINLTITSYMVVAGIVPAILGDLADTIGRRMVYLSMMTVYCTANVGLALQNSWPALFMLRMLQSAGSAGT